MHLILCVKINRAIIRLVRGVKDYGSFFHKKKERNVIKGIILSIPEVGKRNRSFIV